MQVLRLNVAVNDFLAVNVIHRAGNLRADRKLVQVVARAPIANGVPQAFSPQEFHNDKWLATFFAEIVYADDVFMHDAAGHPRFLKEAGFRFQILAAGFGQNLHRNHPPQHRILRPIDVRHSPAQKLDEFVLAETRWKG